MYTLRLPFMRLYVVNSTSLVQKVQRQTRKLSFTPILAQMTASVTGVTAASDQISNVDPLGDHGFVHGLTQKIRAGVNPGPKLDALNRKSVQLIATSLAKFGKQQKTFKVNMKDWVYHEVMMATTGGVYGPRNPFEDAEMRNAFP